MPSIRSDISKRQHIIEVAYTLFKRAGYHATGIDRIIAEAGVAKMTMYRNFPSKDDLIMEVLQDRARRFDAQLDRLAAKAATPGQKIGTIIGWYARWFQRPDFHGCVFQHALAEFGDPGHPVFEAVAKQKNGFKRRLRRILEETMAGAQAESAAAALFMLFEGATLLAQMGQGSKATRNLQTAAASIIGTPVPLR